MSEHGYVRELEQDLVHRWWSLPVGTHLLLSDGNCSQLVFAGRPGSALGPDVHDAVLDFSYSHKHRSARRTGKNCEHRNRQSGDVEFHVRSSDWFTHQHHVDVRYNKVILHVVLICDCPVPTLRQDGVAIPVCSLCDLYDLPYPPPIPIWPCQQIIPQMSDEERTHLLQQAGLLRFEQKTHAFVELLHDVYPQTPFSAYDTCLIPALAEGLGYGRDRDFFRAVGLRLLGLPHTLPEPLGHTPEPPSLDAGRLRLLHDLVERWRATGGWETMRRAMVSTRGDGENQNVGHYLPPRQGALPGGRIPVPQTASCPPDRVPLVGAIGAIRTIFGKLSMARSDILICNVVLPFAAAVALIEQDMLLGERARELYLAHPGLPSNQVTRAMCKQLLLEKEPYGACQQQGLHYIHQQTCREKRCNKCIMGKRDI